MFRSATDVVDTPPAHFDRGKALGRRRQSAGAGSCGVDPHASHARGRR